MTAARTDVLALTFTIKEPTEYIDRTLATASWWDRYMLQPGTYRIEWQIAYGYTTPIIEYGRVRVDAVLVESYRENRLFTAVSADHREGLDEKTTVSLGTYPWTWMQYAGKPSRDPQIWGGIVRYASVPVEAGVDHIEISDHDDPQGMPAFGGHPGGAHRVLEDGTYSGYGHGKGREGQAVLVVANGESKAVWL